jgi:protein-S-isoprenylcysteine O-methyltransferase Ste14
VRRLETLVPPQVVMVLCAIAIWSLRRYFPEHGVFVPGRRWAYGILAALGVIVAAAGVLEFRRARTTVNPVTPEAASSLVTGGIYRFTRNPIYVGDVLILAAVAVFFSTPLGVAGILLFVFWMDVLQIPAEERALRARFGEAYEAYCARVRRWI